jgi:hypothetical protein
LAVLTTIGAFIGAPGKRITVYMRESHQRYEKEKERLLAEGIVYYPSDPETPKEVR